MSDWNAAQYLKFEKERTQPAIDLAARLPRQGPARLLDIGCGPGNSTVLLADRYPGAEILGVDSSADMIARAQADHPTLSFRLLDAGSELPSLGGGFDVVFSNACIQWIPDHPRLLRQMMEQLRPGGTLAVQTPMNYDEPIHQIIGRLTSGGKWAGRFSQPRIFYNLRPEAYCDLLAETAADYSLWETTYVHRLGSHEDILEWYRGTGLRPYLSALSSADQETFLQDVRREVAKAYPPRTDGAILFPFPRLFFTATK